MSDVPEWFAGEHNKKANECMCHRYLYYCLASPVITDQEYDFLEKDAVLTCDKEHPVHQVGSAWPGSYHKVTRDIAKQMLDEAT